MHCFKYLYRRRCKLINVKIHVTKASLAAGVVCPPGGVHSQICYSCNRVRNPSSCTYFEHCHGVSFLVYYHHINKKYTNNYIHRQDVRNDLKTIRLLCTVFNKKDTITAQFCPKITQ